MRPSYASPSPPHSTRMCCNAICTGQGGDWAAGDAQGPRSQPGGTAAPGGGGDRGRAAGASIDSRLCVYWCRMSRVCVFCMRAAAPRDSKEYPQTHIQVTPPGFHVLPLPWRDELRFPERGAARGALKSAEPPIATEAQARAAWRALGWGALRHAACCACAAPHPVRRSVRDPRTRLPPP